MSLKPPPENTQRAGIALCLSGGGYRAAIFHLGALRWLNQCGLLPRLKMISCVSGGSIIGAHLAFRLGKHWPAERLPDEQWSAEVVEPFRRVVGCNIRTLPVLARFASPLNWFRPHATVEALRRAYIRRLFDSQDPPLSDLPEAPEFIFCATDMLFGVNWQAARDRVGDFEAGFCRPPPRHWTIARAVAASSCFPPVFAPARIYLQPDQLSGGHYSGADRDRRVRQIRLTDGGVYDNLGLQPAIRETRVLVSDGGSLLPYDLADVPWTRLARYPALLQNAVGKLRKSALMRDFRLNLKQGTYWGIASGSTRGGVFPTREQAAQLAAIRTDLNRFTDDEFAVLENHGYLVAAEKTLAKCRDLLVDPPSPEEILPPNRDHWFGGPRIEAALRFSPRRLWPYALR